MTKGLDPVDAQLVAELRRNGRATAVELSRKIRVPRTTIVGRMRRLEEERVLLGYAARVDHAKLGSPVTAFIMVSFTPAPGVDQRQVARTVAAMPGVEEVHIVSGDWDILVKVRAASLEAIGDLVLDRIRKEPGVGRTLTFNSFARIKEP